MTPATASRIPATWICLLVLLAIGAAWVRLHELGARPMHADEANQAVKLGALIERGEYAFDPYDHHGPTLYYFARVTAWIRGEHRLAELTEVTVRLTPALFGVAGVVLLAIAALPLGQRAALMAASFLAISPAAVYFSRYFIQETLLMTFTLAAWVSGVQAFRSRRVGWAIVTGLMLGLMQATKASAPLFIVAALLAWWGSRWGLQANCVNAGSDASSPDRVRGAEKPRKGGKTLFLWGALGFVGVFVTFYSSFFTHARGVIDALATYAPMGGRVSAGESGHDKPWWYYGELFWRHRRGGYLWDQNLFLGLSLLGLVWNAFCRNRTARGVSLYFIVVGLALSLTPYKTPWVVIHLVPPMAMLSGWVLGNIAERWKSWAEAPVIIVFLSVLLSLGFQVQRAVFQRPADSRNPFAYVHSSPDVMKSELLAGRAGSGTVQVISEEYWPLPWYLRKQEQRVGYWTSVPETCDGALLFVSPEFVDEVRSKLKGPYREGFIGLRPGFVLMTFQKE